MKKVSNILTVAGFMFFGAIQSTFAQETAQSETFHQELKKRFIEGDPQFMGIVLVALILGLAIAIERSCKRSLSKLKRTSSIYLLSRIR